MLRLRWCRNVLPYKLNIFLLAITFGGIGYVLSGAWSNLLWIYFLVLEVFSVAAFVLIYRWIEKYVREGHKRIYAVIYLIVLSLLIASLLPVLVREFLTWGASLDSFAFLILILVSLILFILGTIFGIILIFQTYRNLSQDRSPFGV